MHEQDCDSHPIEQILGTLFHPQDAAGKPLLQNQRVLEPSNALWEFMEQMPGGFLIYRAQLGEEILYANQSLLRIFQCETMEEFLQLTGGSFRGFVHPEDLEAVEESIQAQIAASQYDLDYVEYRICRKDGDIRWIEDYGHFVHDEVLGDIFYVFIGDATEKRQHLIAEKKQLINEKLEREQRLLHLSEEYDAERRLVNQEYLRHLEVIQGLSINYEGICYLDLDKDQIVPYRMSRRPRLLFQAVLKGEPYSWYTREYIAMWVHPEDREIVAKATAPDHVREMLASNQTYYFNYRVLVDGELQYLQLRFVSVSNEEGLCQAVMGYHRVDEEIQRQMEQQAQLAEALAKANLAITSKNTFLSNISHDMRTPLHAIFGFTSLAKMNLDRPEDAAGYLEQVEASSRLLLEMIEKVLDVSSKAADNGISEVECDLKETAQKVYDFLQPQAQEKGLAFSLNCSALRHKDVFSDPEKLHQLLLNLANNAITYTNTGGQVTLSIEEGEELTNHYADYRLSVKDTGIGIHADFLEKIFEPFTREKNSTLSGIHSIGLGLTIAKNIVDMMGGTLDVQSQVGQGSVFTVTLRLRRQAWEAIPMKEAEAGEDTMRLLLVEDNELNREIETELLEQLGFSIHPVENGELALEQIFRAGSKDYDLILMDLQMPVMDGWQTSAAIRQLPDPVLSNIPIIALSANMSFEDQEKSRKSGINAHLQKPLDLPLLLRTIEGLTGRSCTRGEADL